MKLTGKTKQEFEKWYVENVFDVNIDFSHMNPVVEHFYIGYSDSMKFGVLVDYFDSVGLFIEICKTPAMGTFYWMVNDGTIDNQFDTRPEARTSAIEKANSIREEQLKEKV